MPASRGLGGAPRWAVLETGFGLGLNFLATWQAWRSDPRRPACLFYSAVEAWVCKAGDLVRSAAPFAELAPLAAELAAQWHGLLPGVHRLSLDGERVQLTLAVGAVQPMLAELSGAHDSLYLDGFSPERNPDMWSEATLAAAARLLRPGARPPPGAWPARCASTWPPAASSWSACPACRPSARPCARAPALGATRTRAPTPSRAGTSRPRAAPSSAAAWPGPRWPSAWRSAAGASTCSTPRPARRRRQRAAGGRGGAARVARRPAAVAAHARGVRATLARAAGLLRAGRDFAATGVLERHEPGKRRRLPPGRPDRPMPPRPKAWPASTR
jgi:tRNA 5-methylaminomethyl-2-thiouridine biosynthesis bifunctional protein